MYASCGMTFAFIACRRRPSYSIFTSGGIVQLGCVGAPGRRLEAGPTGAWCGSPAMSNCCCKGRGWEKPPNPIAGCCCKGCWTNPPPIIACGCCNAVGC